MAKRRTYASQQRMKIISQLAQSKNTGFNSLVLSNLIKIQLCMNRSREDQKRFAACSVLL